MKKLVLSICNLVLSIVCLIICVLNLIFFDNTNLYIAIIIINTIMLVIDIFISSNRRK